MSDRPLGAVNAVTHPVTDYGPDPHNPAMQIARDAMLRLHGWLVPAVVGGDTDPGLQFHGYGPQLQNFVGLASRAGANGATYRNGGNAELSSAVTAGPMGDPARQIFADRLRRRSAM